MEYKVKLLEKTLREAVAPGRLISQSWLNWRDRRIPTLKSI